MDQSKVTIDGVEYALVYDFNRIAEDEAGAGCNLLGALGHLVNLSAVEMRGLLFAMANRVDTGAHLTIEQAGKLVSLETIVPIYNAIFEACGVSVEAAAEPAREPAAEPLSQ
jgi:hypothetical protein